MLASAIVWSGFVLCFVGAVLVARPIRRLGIGTRLRALGVATVGIALAAIGLALPATESRVGRAESRLDEFAPVWQFNELHSIRINAPPEHVYDAIRKVRADEIAFFRALTWIRRGGRDLPESIVNAGDTASLIDIATRTTFVRLVDDAPRELVVGTVVAAPEGSARPMDPAFFTGAAPSGFAVALMNFRVRPDGPGGSIVTTETRVFAGDASTRRRFAAYWRVIYPGSALIRRMWPRAIAKRATATA